MNKTQEQVDLRDYIINYHFNGKNHKELAEMVGLHRTSIYPALNRFKMRCELNREYREKYQKHVAQHKNSAIETNKNE